MATTVREIFAVTMALLDELGERNGEAERRENNDYMQRTPGILNQLQGELYPYSDTWPDTDGGTRPVIRPVTGFEDTPALDDFLCRTVLPCALAARLVLDENPSVAAYYERKQQELLAKHGSTRPTRFRAIENVYGGGTADGGNGGELWP